jgi:LysM repeat protein
MKKRIIILVVCLAVIISALGWFFYQAIKSPVGPPNPPIGDQAICIIAKNDFGTYLVTCQNNSTVIGNATLYVAKSNEDLDKYIGKKVKIKANFLMNKSKTDSILTTTQCIRNICKPLFEDTNQHAYAIVIEEIIEVENGLTETMVSAKPRDKIITYVAEKGDTVQSIGQKFGISPDTVKWANNVTTDTLTEGQLLKILPVTGVAHTVVNGDTVDSLADKYQTDRQAIIDFPFNDFADSETHSLILGKTLIIPDGKPYP